MNNLLYAILALLAVGVVWFVVRGVFRLTTRTFMLGCGLAVGMGAAWLLSVFFR